MGARFVLMEERYRELFGAIAKGERGMKMVCPHCLSLAPIRTSRPLSRMVKEVYCQCSNVACGHTFKAMVEITMTISPSAFPDPAVAAQIELAHQDAGDSP